MEQKLSREELIDLVETIMSVHDKKTGRAHVILKIRGLYGQKTNFNHRRR